MLKEQKNNQNQVQFLKMNGAGNDFIIIDARKNENELNLSCVEIAKMSDRKNIGCDQFIIIKNSNEADCFMEIYNSDGSKSKACGNATRCVASILIEEKNQDFVNIQTEAEILKCYKKENEISVEMNEPKFSDTSFYYDDIKFYIIDVGNPHAVCFLDEIPIDEVFFRIGKEVESHPFFAEKTNVEFAKIINDELIEVRVFERGVGETLSCGTGACAVGVAAIKNKLINSTQVLTRFKGGDLKINWQETSKIIMSGGYKKIFSAILDENFF